MGDYIIHNGELYHWGVKGMKWGIRRYQNKDGSLTELGRKHLAENGIRTEGNLVEKTIPKGTKMYRVTPYEKDGTKSKSTYVTYLDMDRAKYKGGTFVDTISGKDLNDPSVYEHEFELKTDIRIPSLKTVRDIEKRVISNENMRLEVAKSWIESHMMVDDGFTKTDIEIMSNVADKYNKAKTTEQRRALYKELCSKHGNELGDMYYNQSQSISEAKNWIDANDSLIIEQSLGRAHRVKDGIVKELKKLGYNAMYDNASIGVTSNGQYNKQQEGVEPLIIFDSKSTLNELGTKRVDLAERRESNLEYERWLNERSRVLKKYKDTY